jgi:hypothetical protein
MCCHHTPGHDGLIERQCTIGRMRNNVKNVDKAETCIHNIPDSTPPISPTYPDETQGVPSSPTTVSSRMPLITQHTWHLTHGAHHQAEGATWRRGATPTYDFGHTCLARFTLWAEVAEGTV